jgi:hypothetical protein
MPLSAQSVSPPREANGTSTEPFRNIDAESSAMMFKMPAYVPAVAVKFVVKV